MSSARNLRSWTSAATLVACLAASYGAYAQTTPRGPRTASDRSAPPPSQSSSSLSSHAGIAAAERLLASASREDRLRGVHRIGALDDFPAAQTLVRALDENAALFGDERVRLAAVRALAPFAARQPIRGFLVRCMSVPRAADASQLLPLSELARRSAQEAAMALAAANEVQSTETLVAAILSNSASADAAVNALASHPPSNLEPLFSKGSLASPRIVELLGRLGDMRAIPKLRPLVDKGDISLRAIAASSLARLGDEYPVKTARGWLDQAGSTTALREAATETLVLARATDAPRAIAILLADPVTRPAALRLAFDAPTPQLAPSLAGYLTIATPAQRASTLLSLARCGGPVAARTLEKQLGTAASPDTDAVFALAHLAGPEASSALQRLLSKPATRRAAARAALVRFAALGEKLDGLRSALESLLASTDPSDRSTGAQGLAQLGIEPVRDLISAKDLARIRGACRAALVLGRDARQSCADLVRDGVPTAIRDAASIVIAGDVEPSQASTASLLAWAESDDPLALVYARALGARDDDVYRPRLRLLLTSGNPLLRGQVALGLARSSQPSWVSMLVEAAEFELDPAVRRLFVRALSATTAPQRLAFLRETMRLDPDAAARELARLALAGARLDRPASGTRTAWVSLSPNSPQVRTALSRAVFVVPASGFAFGAVSDEDGMLLVPGLPPGDMRIQLAPAVAPPQAATP